jgi:hypothetical protein
MILKQSVAYARKFLMVLTSDHISPATGFGSGVTVKISQGPSGAFGTAAGAVAEIANGWYQVSFTSADLAVLGDLAVNCTHATADPTDFCDQVQTQIFPDLQLSSGQVLVSSNLKQNAPFTALFLMTQVGTNSPAPGLTVNGQRAFGVGGFSPVAGAIAEVGGAGNGGGWYVFNGVSADSNNATAGYKMSAVGANDSDFSLWFQP